MPDDAEFMRPAPKIGQNRGNAGKGRPKGSANKLTVAAKDAIAQAFDRVGGVDGLVEWIEKSDDNRKVFYGTIHPKLLPLQVNGPGNEGEHLHRIVREFYTPHQDG